jgi:hypothetical protein
MMGGRVGGGGREDGVGGVAVGGRIVGVEAWGVSTPVKRDRFLGGGEGFIEYW